MTNRRRFKKPYSRELLLVAQGDLEAARALEQSRVSRKENILFHVQQALEKALKAVICAHELDVPLSHDLHELAQAFPGREQIPRVETIYDLTQFATIRRYEEGVAVITDDEIKAAIQTAKEILDWVEQNIKSKGC